MPRSQEKTNLSVVSNDGKLNSSNGGSDVCQKCFGSGMEIIAGKGARQCECQKKIGKTNPFEKVRVPRRYSECHFNSYAPGNPTQSQAVRYAMKFTQEFPAVDQGLLLMGPVGVGKTHLAVSILKGLTERGGFSCLFCEFGSLLKEIQDSYNPVSKSTELKVLSSVYETDVLVLDELGATIPTDWVRDTMYQIINKRYNDRKLTILTTNYSDARDSDREQTLEDRIGTRLRSRLYEMCTKVVMDGGDYRRVGL